MLSYLNIFLWPKVFSKPSWIFFQPCISDLLKTTPNGGAKTRAKWSRKKFPTTLYSFHSSCLYENVLNLTSFDRHPTSMFHSFFSFWRFLCWWSSLLLLFWFFYRNLVFFDFFILKICQYFDEQFCMGDDYLSRLSFFSWRSSTFCDLILKIFP